MTNDSTKSSISQPASDTTVYLFDDWFDPIEAGVRDRVRGFIEAMIEGELVSALLRPRYGRKPKLANEDADGSAGLTGHRHGHRSRSLMGTFGCVEIGVPRARINGEDGKTLEWKSKVLRAYQRRTVAADALIASTYLSGTNTRRVRRALTTLFRGAVSKDIVSRIWRKVKCDWMRGEPGSAHRASLLFLAPFWHYFRPRALPRKIVEAAKRPIVNLFAPISKISKLA
jgi:hypothetical protein